MRTGRRIAGELAGTSDRMAARNFAPSAAMTKGTADSALGSEDVLIIRENASHKLLIAPSQILAY